MIFTGQVTGRSPRPQWLLNLTNDAWFGQGAGPRQHFAMARTRAIEEGLPLVRVANSGISAIIDAYGRATASSALGEPAVIDGELPAALASQPPYARLGDRVLIAMILACLGLAAGLSRRPPPE